jgi:serine phosphatase RsbU (regulator of sigma subunit)
MADRGSSPAAESLPDDWPAHSELSLALNRMGSFDWDLDSGLMHLDESAMEIYDLRPDEYDGTPQSLLRRIPQFEGARLDAQVAQALKDATDGYSMYYRIRLRDGSLRWTHAQTHIRYDETGQARRIIGIVRDAEQEMAETGTGSEAAGRQRRLTGVVERITALLANAVTVRDVADVLRDPEALGYLGVVSARLGVVEEERFRVVVEGRLGRDAPELTNTEPGAQLPMSEAARTQRPRFVISREEFQSAYPRLWPYLESLPVNSGAFLPLIVQGGAIGSVGLFYPQQGRFGTEERNLLVALASSIAQSLQRAMFFEQEHHLAESLQQAMLPRSIPAVPGARITVRYRSARVDRRSIGGDWYDVIPLPSGRVGLTIGDVQGHDTDAAVVMGQLRNVLWAYAAEGHPPSTVMARASAFLEELDTDRFATCTYVEADLSTGSLQAVRAGHFSPLVRRTDGTCDWFWAAGGLPLGLSATFAGQGGIDYPVTTGWLGPGATLLLCTDGLMEQPGTYLGDSMELLRETVRTGPADVEELADLLRDGVGDLTDSDDMALLLLQRDPEQPESG